jgi:hypothetical protein
MRWENGSVHYFGWDDPLGETKEDAMVENWEPRMATWRELH